MTTITALPARCVLRLTGPATLKFLHDVSTQDVAPLRPGDSALLAFLDDKGRILADARVTATDEGAIVDAEEAATDGLERAVTRIAPLAGVDVEAQRWEALRYDGAEMPRDALDALGVLAVPVSWGGSGFDLLAPSLRAVRATFTEGGAAEGDLAAVEEARIAAGRPRFGVDIDAATLINETPLLTRAVSFTKGCYPGQESVARVHNLGQVRRKLRVLRLDAPVRAGDAVRVGAENVGTVTSTAGSHALAFLASDVEVASPVVVGDATAVVTDAGWSTGR